MVYFVLARGKNVENNVLRATIYKQTCSATYYTSTRKYSYIGLTGYYIEGASELE